MARVMRSAGLLAALLSVHPADAAAPARVDWIERVVHCAGLAPPTLQEEADNVAVTRVRTARAADQQAVHGCVDALRGVLITGGDTVGARLDHGGAFRSAVTAIVKKAIRASEPRFFSDGGVAVDAAVPLEGPLSALLIGAAASSGPPAPSPATPGGAQRATGVIVDARAVEVVPALAPRILDDAGGTILGPAALTDRGRQAGGAAYARSMDEAVSAGASRVGSAPLVVKALSSRGCDLIVGASDAVLLRGLPALADGRVIVVRGG